jgi:hypothetical protein
VCPAFFIGDLMRILFTGMASAHVKESPNISFFGTMVDVCREFADVVDVMSPSIEWTEEYLNSYDAVFVGLLPPTSPSANKLYGALNVISLLADSPKLKFVVDHPQVWQFKSSISSVAKNIESIFTPFYRTKSEYKSAILNKEKLSKAIELLSSSKWPVTVYPSLPWKNSETLTAFLPGAAVGDLVGLNFDSFLLSEEFPGLSSRIDEWKVEAANTTWATKISKLTSYPVEKVKPNIRATDSEVFSIISSSAGLILAAQDRGVGTWWSYRIIQALNSMTPVITEWKESHSISPSWGVLIAEVEDMDFTGRLELAMSQKASYLKSIPAQDEAIESLKKLIATDKEII